MTFIVTNLSEKRDEHVVVANIKENITILVEDNLLGKDDMNMMIKLWIH